MLMRHKFLLTAALCGASMQAAPASAAVLVYTSESDFLAALYLPATYDFEGIAPANGFAILYPTIAGVTFTANGIPFVVDAAATPVYGASFFSGQGNHDNDPANAVSISFTGRKAFGFTYGSYISASETYSATLSTGDVFDFATASTPGTALFLGFISDTPFTSIDLVSTIGVNVDDSTGYGYAFDITSFTLAVPEPASWAMMIAGLGLAGAAMRRRAKVTGGRVSFS